MFKTYYLRVPLILATVLLLVHLLGLLAGVVLDFLALSPWDNVLFKELFGLEGTGSGEGLFGKSVVDGLALLTLLLLPHVHGSEANTGANGLVGEAALRLLLTVVESVTLFFGLA